MIKIWYLYHSGFAVKTDNHLLVFDYWKNMPKGGALSDGVVDPEALRCEDVVVFVSHAHHDHFNREVLKWQKVIPQCSIILSDDIRPVDGAISIGPNQTLEEKNFTVETLCSNDAGVAFLVEIDCATIYHAGDLNWWHWEGEPDPWNPDIERSYKEQIARLTGKKIDLAFVPVDPRLGKQYYYGIDHLMRTLDVRYVVPMHFSEDAGVVGRLLADPVSKDYRERILPLTLRGQCVEIDI